jgi:O-acetylhomoserine (thiol)-lyase
MNEPLSTGSIEPAADARTGAGGVPIHQTATFAYPTAQDIADVFRGRAPGHVYTRISNPTTLALEQRLTGLERGIGCVATSSGMAAISSVMVALLRSGDEVLSASGIFGGTVSLFTNVLGRFGVHTAWADAGDANAFRAAITPATRVIFVETISNPGMQVPDLPGLSTIAREHGIPLVVDSTLTTPALIRPGDHGADIIVHSTTKFINGHGTAIGGAVIDTGRYDWRNGRFDDLAILAKKAGRLAFLAQLRLWAYRDLGGCPAPQSSHQMLQGLETLGMRMHAHCYNAHRVAEALASRGDVAWVNYPGLPGSRFRPLVTELFSGRGGGVLTVGFGSERRAFRFLDRLKRASIAANLGETRTLVIHPASTIFADHDPEERERMGVGEDLVRISAGLESHEEILEDMIQALEASAEVKP